MWQAISHFLEGGVGVAEDMDTHSVIHNVTVRVVVVEPQEVEEVSVAARLECGRES